MTDHYREAEKLLRDPHLDEHGETFREAELTGELEGAIIRANLLEQDRDEWKVRAQVAEAARVNEGKRADAMEEFADRFADQRDLWMQRANKAEARIPVLESTRGTARAEADRLYRKLHALECDHGYRLTDSCPGCAADEAEDANEGRRPECRECTPGVGCAEACWKPDHPTPAKTESQLGNDTDHEQDVATALHAADGGDAGHWPTVAAVLAYEVRRLQAKGGSSDA